MCSKTPNINRKLITNVLVGSVIVVVVVVVVLVTVVVAVSKAFTSVSPFTNTSDTIKRFSMILQAAIM